MPLYIYIFYNAGTSRMFVNYVQVLTKSAINPLLFFIKTKQIILYKYMTPTSSQSKVCSPI